MSLAPLLALAAIVELRLTRWHEFSPLVRWSLGLFAGIVLVSLGDAVATSQFVRQQWDPAVPVSQYRQQSTYWSIYVGLWGVILLPVMQLWAVVFIDLPLFKTMFQAHRVQRTHKRLIEDFTRLISRVEGRRREISEMIYKQVLKHPEGVYARTPQGGYRVDIVDPMIKVLRSLAEETDKEIEAARKDLRRMVKRRGKLQKEYNKIVGAFPRRARKVLEGYQRVPK